MAYRHPADPPQLHAAAARLGELVGKGQLRMHDAQECAELWAREAHGFDQSDWNDPGFVRLVHGLLSRLCHAINDAADDFVLRHANASRQIAWRLRPLLDRRVPSAQLVGAAKAANDNLGNPLDAAEVDAVIDDSIAAALRRFAWEQRNGQR